MEQSSSASLLRGGVFARSRAELTPCSAGRPWPQEGKGWIEQGSCLTSSYWVWGSCLSALETLGVGLRGS